MASLAKKQKTRRKMRLKRAGRKRKAQESKASTLAYDKLFEGFGEPGSPKL